jgi:hypothetical protein
MKRLVARGGRVVPGSGVGRAGLLGRSRRLARASAGVVAFLWGAPRGSGFTVGEAIRPRKPAAVVLAGGGAELPSFPGGTWVPCSIGSVAAFRWVPGPEGEHPTRKTWLAGVFQVPEGEPTHALLTHISSLSQGDRLWFERGIVGGDTVLVPHEALSDTPALLAIPRLTRRFRCTVREASGLAELFLALDASPAVVAHYEAEARCRRIASIVDDLVHPVAGLALVEQGPDTDALEDAECLGDGAEWVTEDGQVAQRGVQPEEDGAHRAWQTVAWHALGTVQPERVACPVCRAVFEADDDTPEIPTCPECGTRDTWEARQGMRFRGLIGAIDHCPSLEELAALGKRLYVLQLSHDQAGVTWSHYHLRKQARVLLAEVEHASRPFLPRLGACLYRVQQTTAIPVSAPEWWRIWRAYQSRKLGVTDPQRGGEPHVPLGRATRPGAPAGMDPRADGRSSRSPALPRGRRVPGSARASHTRRAARGPDHHHHRITRREQPMNSVNSGMMPLRGRMSGSNVV